MPNLLLVLFTLFLFFIFIFLFLNYKKKYNRPTKSSSFSQLIPTTTNEQEHNPDINTKNWDLHKIRLNKFGRSQYKGLTFFVSSEYRIYYLSEKGTKVYC